MAHLTAGKWYNTGRMNTYLIWLEWPEKCFRVNGGDLRHLETLVPGGSRVVRVRSERAFLKALPYATHAVVWHFRREWFALATKLKVLATPGAGRELVSLDAPKGVKLHFGGFHGAIMAESVAAFMLAWARGFFLMAGRECSVRNWPRTWLSDKCFTLAGTRAVVVGYGRVGRAIGAKLEALGVSVVGVTRRAPNDLKSRTADLKNADWLVMALPSDTGTDNLLDAKLIARLPRRCVVVNVGRGNAVDEEALLAALRSGRIAGAYLDVFKGEPTLNRGKPVILKEKHTKTPRNLIKTPHSSAFSAKYIKTCFDELKNDGVL